MDSPRRVCSNPAVDADATLAWLRGRTPPLTDEDRARLAATTPARLTEALIALCEEGGESGVVLATEIGRRLRSPAAADALASVAEGTAPSAVKKAARRALHLLEQAGLRAAPPPPEVFRVETEKPGRAFESPCDHEGRRFVALVRETLSGWLRAYLAVVGGGRPLARVLFRKLPRPMFDRVLGELYEERFGKLLEVPFASGAEHVRLALLESRRSGTPDADEPRLLEFLGPPRPAAPHPAAALLSPLQGASDGALVERSAALYEEPLFFEWFLREGELGGLVEEARATSRSSLVLGGRSPEQRREELAAEGARRLFDSARRERLREPLADQIAHLLAAGRRGAAEVAAAVHRALGREELPPDAIPFLVVLVQRGLAAALGEAQVMGPDQPASSSVVLPGSSSMIETP